MSGTYGEVSKNSRVLSHDAITAMHALQGATAAYADRGMTEGEAREYVAMTLEATADQLQRFVSGWLAHRMLGAWVAHCRPTDADKEAAIAAAWNSVDIRYYDVQQEQQRCYRHYGASIWSHRSRIYDPQYASYQDWLLRTYGRLMAAIRQLRSAAAEQRNKASATSATPSPHPRPPRRSTTTVVMRAYRPMPA